MATVSTNWTTFASSIFLNNLDTSGDQSDVQISGLSNGAYFGTWTAPSNGYVEGRVVRADNTPITDEFLANTTTTNQQFQSSVAGLSNGNALVAFTDFSTDPGGDIRGRLFTDTGTPIGNDFVIAGDTVDQREPSAARLGNGGAVVSYTKDFGSGDHDVRAQRVGADGSLVGSEIIVSSTSGALNSEFSSVARTNNGFVVVWQESPAAGGSTSVYYRRYNDAGVALDANPVLIDNIGAINNDIHVTGLADGGFAVAYTDNGWGQDGTEITSKVFNADGTSRTGYLEVNTNHTGSQTNASITSLPNGGFAVGFLDGTEEIVQGYTANGTTLGTNSLLQGSVVNGTIAALANGQVALARTSTVSEGSGTGNSIRSSVHDLVRTTTGDGTSETLTGDQLSDVVNAGGGSDLVNGGGGRDTLDGGAGIDTAQFSLSRKLATISHDLSGHVLVDSGGNDHAILSNFERYQFTDALLTNPSTAHDFGGDGHADILYRQNSSGNTVLAQLNGSHAAAPSAFTGVQLGPDWNIVSTASDFNNDGHADILFRNAASGATILSEMNGAQQLAPSAFTDVQVNNSYAIAGTADFNGDGNADILYRNVATGQTVLSELNGPHQAAPSAFTDVQLDNSFAVAGTGDFNGDGNADILYRKASSGSTLIAFQNGPNQAAPSAFTDVQVGNDYKVWVGDFDGDGKSDLLFRNVNTGQTAVSLMDGSHQKAPTAFTDVQLNNQFEIAQVSDFNGDGTADILFRDATSGATLVAFMNGAHQAAPSAFTDVQVDHSWSIA